MKARTYLSLLTIAIGVTSGNPAMVGAYQYLVTDLGTLSGPISSPASLNAAGVVVGMGALSDSHFHAAVFGASTVDLGVISGDSESAANAINDAGMVVGISYDYGDLQVHAFLWQGGTLTPLGDFLPRDVTVNGVIAGHRTLYNTVNLWVNRACRWENNAFVDLGTLGGNNSEARAIDTAGRIVGTSFLSNNQTFRACLWLNNSPMDLGSLSGTSTANSEAVDINNIGQIVGWSDSTSGWPHGFLYQVNSNGMVTQRVDLGSLGIGFSHAYSINNSGVVVGASNSRAFVWNTGTMTDLNAAVPPGSGWFLSKAVAINDSGQIACEGIRHGFSHALLLTPVICTKGDMNNDGMIDGQDIQSFVNVLLMGGTSQQVCAGDMADAWDGSVTEADIPSFVLCLLNRSCP